MHLRTLLLAGNTLRLIIPISSWAHIAMVTCNPMETWRKCVPAPCQRKILGFLPLESTSSRDVGVHMAVEIKVKTIRNYSWVLGV